MDDAAFEKLTVELQAAIAELRYVKETEGQSTIKVKLTHCSDCSKLVEILLLVRDWEFDPDQPSADDIPVCTPCLDERDSDVDLGGEGEPEK